MGVGGTTAKFMSLQKMIDDYSDVETLIVPAGEILASGGSRRLTKNSLVITGSKSGDGIMKDRVTAHIVLHCFQF